MAGCMTTCMSFQLSLHGNVVIGKFPRKSEVGMGTENTKTLDVRKFRKFGNTVSTVNKEIPEIRKYRKYENTRNSEYRKFGDTGNKEIPEIYGNAAARARPRLPLVKYRKY